MSRTTSWCRRRGPYEHGPAVRLALRTCRACCCAPLQYLTFYLQQFVFEKGQLRPQKLFEAVLRLGGSPLISQNVNNNLLIKNFSGSGRSEAQAPPRLCRGFWACRGPGRCRGPRPEARPETTPAPRPTHRQGPLPRDSEAQVLPAARAHQALNLTP